MTGLEVLDGEFDLNTMAEDEVETGSQQVGVMAHESGDKTTIYDVIIVGAGLAGKCQDISTHFEHFKLNRRPPSDITVSHIQNYTELKTPSVVARYARKSLRDTDFCLPRSREGQGMAIVNIL